MLHFDFRCGILRLDASMIYAWLAQVVGEYGYRIGELNYIFCSDEELLAMNRHYLGHDYYTDVITFDYSCGERLSGDIFISVDSVRSNIAIWGDSRQLDGVSIELYRVMVHGVLHLTGQEDKTRGGYKLMKEKEDRALLCLFSLFGKKNTSDE